MFVHAKGNCVMAQFKVGDPVTKCTGDYHIDGEVRAVFTPYVGGPVRYVVAHPAKLGVMLHIYNESNLKKAD